jgi:hypothetical protein
VSQPEPPPLTEEEMRALEAELERVTVDDVILQTIVSLINLGARKGAVGAPPESGLKADPEQLQTAIEAVRALTKVIEPRHGDKLAPIRDALSQLQLAYARLGSGAPEESEPPKPGDAGPAQKSGRLWVPGQ